MTQSRSTHVPARSSEAKRDADAPPLHVLLDVLANRRRRHALQCLCESGAPMTIQELADEVATLERAREAVPNLDGDRITVSLSHCHVPKLAEAEIVAYTRKYDEVELSVAPSVVEPFLKPPHSSARAAGALRP